MQKQLNYFIFPLKTIISATQSRKKQQTELVKSVLFAEKDKKRKERENLPITSIAVAQLAAQEPSFSIAAQPEPDQDEGKVISKEIEINMSPEGLK